MGCEGFAWVRQQIGLVCTQSFLCLVLSLACFKTTWKGGEECFFPLPKLLSFKVLFCTGLDPSISSFQDSTGLPCFVITTHTWMRAQACYFLSLEMFLTLFSLFFPPTSHLFCHSALHGYPCLAYSGKQNPSTVFLPVKRDGYQLKSIPALLDCF